MSNSDAVVNCFTMNESSGKLSFSINRIEVDLDSDAVDSNKNISSITVVVAPAYAYIELKSFHPTKSFSEHNFSGQQQDIIKAIFKEQVIEEAINHDFAYGLETESDTEKMLSVDMYIDIKIDNLFNIDDGQKAWKFLQKTH